MQKKISSWIKRRKETKAKRSERKTRTPNILLYFVEISQNVKILRQCCLQNCCCSFDIWSKTICRWKVYCLNILSAHYRMFSDYISSLPIKMFLQKWPTFHYQFNCCIYFFVVKIKVVIVCFIKFFAYSFFLDFSIKNERLL